MILNPEAVRRNGSTVLATAAVLGLIQVLPAATWLSPVRRLTPALAGRGRAGHVALTFDDGPHPASTPVLLDLLAAHEVRATFFVTGERVRQHPELLQEIHQRGHETAVHGWSHVNFLRVGHVAAARQLERTVDLLEELTGRRPVWFRPPYGALSTSAWWAARQVGLRPVLWTAWARDWEAPDPATIVRRLSDGAGPGGTVLLHDSPYGGVAGADASCRAAVATLVDQWQASGKSIGPLGEHGVLSGST
jgi:peptidoglycan-N-acetylglucosamine deacetylase